MADLSFKKSDDELQVVFAEVFSPGVPDSQGDFMVADEIRKMAYAFMQNGHTGNIDREHDNQKFGACVVESFIARDDDPLFIPGAWVIGVHVPDPVQWAMVKNGTFNGFSLDGEGDRVERALNLTIPDKLVGETTETQNHTHQFTVRFDTEGRFLGGETNIVNGHMHTITKGTITDEAQGHTHRFSHVEQIDGQVNG